MIKNLNEIYNFLKKHDELLNEFYFDKIVNQLIHHIYEIYHEYKNNDYVQYINHFDIEFVHDKICNDNENNIYLCVTMNYFNKHHKNERVEKFAFIIDCECDVCYNEFDITFERYFELLKKQNCDFLIINEFIEIC